MSDFDEHMANYRRVWAREIRRNRHIIAADQDMHIDHDWVTSLIGWPRADHRRLAMIERSRR